MNSAATLIRPNLPKIDPTDDAEQFILAALQRYHENSHTQLIAIRRTWRIVDGSRQRVFLTVSCFRPQRPEAAEEVDLIVWNIDEVSVRFHRQPRRAAALRLFRLADQSERGD